jgi:hypothetical protein
MNRFKNLTSKSSLIISSVNRRQISNSKILQAGFTRDYKPSEQPKNQLEMEQAAKKYGMM